MRRIFDDARSNGAFQNDRSPLIPVCGIAVRWPPQTDGAALFTFPQHCAGTLDESAGDLQRSRRIFSDKRRLDAVQEQTRIEGKAANFDVLGRINIPCWIIHFEYATDRSVGDDSIVTEQACLVKFAILPNSRAPRTE